MFISIRLAFEPTEVKVRRDEHFNELPACTISEPHISKMRKWLQASNLRRRYGGFHACNFSNC